MGKEAATVTHPVAASSFFIERKILLRDCTLNADTVLFLMMSIAIALGISFLIPLGYLYLIWNLDLFGTGKFRYNLTAMLWGMFASALATLINSALLKNDLVTYDQLLRVAAPIVEEILKSLVLFYLVRRADFNYVVDGAIYGSGAGISFAMIENYQYVIGHPGIAITLAVSRVLSTNLVHATTSGLIGSALAAGRTGRGSRKIFTALGGMVLATGIHMSFNTIVDDGKSLIYAIIFGFAGAALISTIIQRALKVQQAWIGETLGIADGVTRSEATAAQRIQSLDDILSPVARQFGADKTLLTKDLLFMQAEIGIKRKILEKTQDEKLRPEIESEIRRIVADMNKMRKAIGPYCMLFVRTVYLEKGSKVWDVINQRVAAAGLGQAGGGLWARLDNRLKESKTQETNHE